MRLQRRHLLNLLLEVPHPLSSHLIVELVSEIDVKDITQSLAKCNLPVTGIAPQDVRSVLGKQIVTSVSLTVISCNQKMDTTGIFTIPLATHPKMEHFQSPMRLICMVFYSANRPLFFPSITTRSHLPSSVRSTTISSTLH